MVCVCTAAGDVAVGEAIPDDSEPCCATAEVAKHTIRKRCDRRPLVSATITELVVQGGDKCKRWRRKRSQREEGKRDALRWLIPF